MVGPGLLIGRIEGWRIHDAVYFTFVTGLTIGYGDLALRHIVSRFLAVVIGFAGIVLTGLVAAVSVEGAPDDGPRCQRMKQAAHRVFGSIKCTTRQRAKEEQQPSLLGCRIAPISALLK